MHPAGMVSCLVQYFKFILVIYWDRVENKPGKGIYGKNIMIEVLNFWPVVCRIGDKMGPMVVSFDNFE